MRSMAVGVARDARALLHHQHSVVYPWEVRVWKWALYFLWLLFFASWPTLHFVV